MVFYKRYKEAYEQYKYQNPQLSENDLIEKSYQNFYKTIQSDTGHYFLYLYNIAKYIYKSDVPNKEFYANLLRAQLSYSELALLFYNCLSIPTENKFKPIIETFSIFKNLPQDMLIDKEAHMALYKESAFKKNDNNG